MTKLILLILALSACNFKHDEKYEKPSNKQLDCLGKVNAAEDESIKISFDEFVKASKSGVDDDLINYELANRRNVERICMLKADCYSRLKGIEFSSCLNNDIGHYE